MKATILGTSQMDNILQKVLDREKLDNLLDEISQVLVENCEEVFVVPQEGVYFDVAMRYKEKGGKKVTGLVPSGDEKYRIDHIKHNLDKVDHRIDLKDWYWLNGEIASKEDVAIVLGYSGGVFSDLSFIKYHRKFLEKETKVIIFENTVSQRLPPEFEKDIGDVSYITSPEELERILKSY